MFMLLIKVTCIICLMTGKLQIRVYTIFVWLIYIICLCTSRKWGRQFDVVPVFFVLHMQALLG